MPWKKSSNETHLKGCDHRYKNCLKIKKQQKTKTHLQSTKKRYKKHDVGPLEKYVTYEPSKPISLNIFCPNFKILKAK